MARQWGQKSKKQRRQANPQAGLAPIPPPAAIMLRMANRRSRGKAAHDPFTLDELLEDGNKKGIFSVADVPEERWDDPDMRSWIDNFRRGRGVRTEISKIWKVVESMQTPGYEAIKRKYEEKGMRVEPRLLWHGTKGATIATILSHGFAVLPQPVNGRALGHGIYFSPMDNPLQSMSFSIPDKNGESSVGWSRHRRQLICYRSHLLLFPFQVIASCWCVPSWPPRSRTSGWV